MNKDEFLRLLSKNTQVSLQDTRYIWSEVEKIFEECVDNREVLNLKGIGHLVFIPVKPRKGHNIATGEIVDLPETMQVRFRVSRNLRDRLLPLEKQKIYLTRQAELRRQQPELFPSNSEDSDDDSEDLSYLNSTYSQDD